MDKKPKKAEKKDGPKKESAKKKGAKGKLDRPRETGTLKVVKIAGADPIGPGGSQYRDDFEERPRPRGGNG